MQAAPSPYSTLLYAGQGLRVGSFRRYPWQRPFEDTGPIRGYLLVFPQNSVLIEHEGKRPVVADATRVMLYNRGQRYLRRALSERGDECEWFDFAPELVRDALRAHHARAAEDPERPFAHTHAPSTRASYLLQRRIVEHLRRAPQPDPLLVEESMLRLLAATSAALTPGPAQPSPPGGARHRHLAEACRAELGRRIEERLSLTALAAQLEVSPFHLTRVFHRQTGMRLHAYLTELRLRRALEQVGSGVELAQVAAELGFASHSHFTLSFRRAFGAPPRALRQQWRARS